MLIVNKKYESLDKIIFNKSVNESVMSAADYSKHDYKYPLAVIDSLLSEDGEFRLGAKGEEDTVLSGEVYDEIRNALINLKNNIEGSTPADFNKAVAELQFKWNDIFKGDFTGYKDGLASKNKGNAFEDEFIRDYASKYEKEVKKLTGYKKRTGDPIPEGGKNQKRPLTFSSGSITCGPAGNYDIGHTVTDVTIPTNLGDIYLSLKYGDKVTFVNAGIKSLFPKSFFDGEKLKGNGKDLLDMFSIDEDTFRKVFNSYNPKDGKKQRAAKTEVDITNDLKRNPKFKEFIKSAMGYGYLMAHKTEKGDVEFINLLKENNMNDFVSGIESATIEYPTDGSAKRVDIQVKYPKIAFKINIRSKTGGIFPTHIMADYKFLK